MDVGCAVYSLELQNIAIGVLALRPSEIEAVMRIYRFDEVFADEVEAINARRTKAGDTSLGNSRSPVRGPLWPCQS